MTDIFSYIERMSRKDIEIVFLHAHPDDESFLTAGLMSRCAQNGFSVRVLFLVSGLDALLHRTYVRRREAELSSATIGIENPVFFDYFEPKSEAVAPDRVFSKQDIKSVSDKVLEELHRLAPRRKILLFSYDKNGGYGNIDHKRVHLVGRMIRQSIGTTILLESTINRNRINQWLEAHKHRPDSELPLMSYWDNEFGLPEEQIEYCFDLSERELEIKKLSMKAHRSQLKDSEFPLSLTSKGFASFFGCEYYHKL